MFKFRDWGIALIVALAVHVAVLALAALNIDNGSKLERSAGPKLEVIGASSLYSAVEETESPSEEITPDTPTTEITEVEAESVEPEIVKPPVETPLEELKETPVDDALAVQPVLKKPDEVKKPEVKKPKKKLVKKEKKKKVKKTAATKKGGGANGKQNKAAGKASASNYRGKVRAHIARRKRSVGSNRGTAVVRFTVSASGGVSGVKLVRSSRNSAVDRAAVAMVRGARLPSIPPGLPRRMTFTLPLRFR